MRVALLSHNAQAGDALGNQVAEKLALFLEHQADVRVFLESDRRLHPAVRKHCRVLGRPEPRGEAWRFLTAADLVVVEYGQYYRLLELLPLLGGKARILFDYHGVTPPEWLPAHNREALEAGSRNRGLVWCADAALVHSRFGRQELHAATGFPAGRTFTLGYPLDREAFRPGGPAGALRQRLGLGDAALLLFVGRLAPNKDVPTLVEALALLRDRTPAVHAVLVGDAGDAYQAEARRCRELADARGVGDRVHLLGEVGEEQLRDAYRSADLLVLPSRHEGFGLPVVEAMASGLPVVAARAAALPETVAGAGLTFTPGDAGDLARQVGRVLGDRGARAEGTPGRPLRVAVVAFRYGTDFAGGAEASLRAIAETLHPEHHVEVFTTCTRAEHAWSNQLPEGTGEVNGIAVHRFPIDPHDRDRHREAVRAVLEAEGPVAPGTEREYLEHSLHSARLLEALRARREEFDVILTGPYLFGLTLDVARAFPDQTVLLPCFHDEPVARLRAWPEVYGRVAGVLYHSPEEQDFAQGRLGLNHPVAACVDGWLETRARGCPERGAAQAGTPGRYLLYCGRYSAQKGLPELLDRVRRYLARHPDRFTFVFIGQGEVAIPREPGLRDLGFVEDAVKRDLLAGAAALVQPSRFESLSYAALEAWAQGTPVLADGRCEVLAGHLERCGGGRAVGSSEEFARALDELWEQPDRWRALGVLGQEYVGKRYGCRAAYREKVGAVLRGVDIPLAERMRAAGLRRAEAFDRGRWREQFLAVVEEVLHAGPRGGGAVLEVKPRSTERRAAAGTGTVLVPVRVVNRGDKAVLATGPGRTVLRCRVLDEAGQPRGEADTELPGLLMPGRALAAAVAVPVPAHPGAYRVGFRAAAVEETPGQESPESWLRLTAEGEGANGHPTCCSPLLEAAQSALAEAHRAHHLPADYTDVTEGWFASWKRRVKRKLLNNFKRAYVDVLSRQQTTFNRAVLAALEELGECCATLDHARGGGEGAKVVDLFKDLAGRLEDSEQRCAVLEERLARLEARLLKAEL